MRRMRWLLACWVVVGLRRSPVSAEEPSPGAAPALDGVFPAAREPGGLAEPPARAGRARAPSRSRRSARSPGSTGTSSKAAWEHNAAAPGATGLLVIRKGQVVGEWYKDGDRTTAFNIYSSSKSYTSTAFGLILADFGNGTLPGGRTLTLDTKVCNDEWIPESLPLPDPRKAEITVRHLLNMASGIGPEPMPMEKPFETALGHVEGSPFAQAQGRPGHGLQLQQRRASRTWSCSSTTPTGSDLFPFLKPRLLDPIGMEQVRWQTIGGDGGDRARSTRAISGIYTNPREHARFCYLALHKGEWAGRRIVPAAYYDFAWTGTKVKPDYGAQWWVSPRIPGAPATWP